MLHTLLTTRFLCRTIAHEFTTQHDFPRGAKTKECQWWHSGFDSFLLNMISSRRTSEALSSHLLAFLASYPVGIFSGITYQILRLVLSTNLLSSLLPNILLISFSFCISDHHYTSLSRPSHHSLSDCLHRSQ